MTEDWIAIDESFEAPIIISCRHNLRRIVCTVSKYRKWNGTDTVFLKLQTVVVQKKSECFRLP